MRRDVDSGLFIQTPESAKADIATGAGPKAKQMETQSRSDSEDTCPSPNRLDWDCATATAAESRNGCVRFAAVAADWPSEFVNVRQFEPGVWATAVPIVSASPSFSFSSRVPHTQHIEVLCGVQATSTVVRFANLDRA